MGGSSFGPVSLEEVSSEIYVLQGIGDPEVECGEEEIDDKEQALLVAAPYDTHVLISFKDEVVNWKIKKGQHFQEAALDFCKATLQEETEKYSHG